MHLTPEILEATYDWLRATPPFRRWKLPAGEEVEFAVSNSNRTIGQCEIVKGRFRITASARLVAHTYTLARVIAHEMCHIRADVQGERTTHGRLWKRAAVLICKEHGFDPREF